MQQGGIILKPVSMWKGKMFYQFTIINIKNLSTGWPGGGRQGSSRSSGGRYKPKAWRRPGPLRPRERPRRNSNTRIQEWTVVLPALERHGTHGGKASEKAVWDTNRAMQSWVSGRGLNAKSIIPAQGTGSARGPGRSRRTWKNVNTISLEGAFKQNLIQLHWQCTRKLA